MKLPPVDGQTTLDFNKAENSSCAFTPYATCPLPPDGNDLAIAINAGEKRYDHEDQKSKNRTLKNRCRANRQRLLFT